jgi:hypothetical protein
MVSTFDAFPHSAASPVVVPREVFCLLDCCVAEDETMELKCCVIDFETSYELFHGVLTEGTKTKIPDNFVTVASINS